MRKIAMIGLALAWLVLPTALAQFEDDPLILARYAVEANGDLTLLEGEPTQDDQRLWRFVQTVLPQDILLDYVYEFVVFEDPATLAFVTELEEDVWEFAVGVDDDPELTLTLIHEFGHILALNDEQFDTYATILADAEGDIDSDAAYDAGITRDQDACDTLAFEDGCPLPDSYLYEFTQTFWDDTYDDWFADYDAEDEDLYFEDPRRYITAYASTNPVEDFAESFAYFVALDQIPSDSLNVAYDKLQWFYADEDLVAIREAIRANLRENDIIITLPPNE